ncbi:HAD family hydrolase [Alteromonas gilva]|uniref:HAD family hydrolase n=1 Tax=Alteromonas gilva TaxID=2987522 RepID=A0ABT5L0C1_9ALTE|nr:hypothetical protein [Alteromonas gilva]MDC8830470.1 hypothetical protein [Alteromonas gilva]
MTSFLTQQINQAIESKQVKLVSFDLFDTLIYRKADKPASVFAEAFDLVSHKLTMQLNARDYEELRQFAEKNLKNKTKSREVSLQQIIATLPVSAQDQETLLQAELAAEKRHGFIDAELKALILALRKQGTQIIFISDMYLTAAQIRQCFFYDEPELADIPLYVSCERQANKASGELFKQIQAIYQIEYAQWLHIGDHEISDVKNPRLLGIAAIHAAPMFNLKRITEAETKIFNARNDCNAVRQLAALHRPPEVDVPCYELGAIIWGPTLLGFCDWVIENVLTQQASHILCVMREGEVFAPLIEKRLSQRQLSEIKVIKLYASRKSTFWPSIDITSDDWFESVIKILVGRRGYSVADFCKDFGFTPKVLLSQFADLDFKKTDGVYFEGESVFKLLCQQAKANTQPIKAKIAQQKTQFMAYYQQAVGVELSQCVTVDLGNGGTIQNHLEQTLGMRAAANLLLYSTNRIYGRLDTLYQSFIAAHNDSDNLRRLLARSPECIESFLLGNIGTTLGYSSSGEPQLGNATKENDTLVSSFYRGVEQFFDLFLRYNLPQSSLRSAVAILSRFVRMPTVEEANIYTRLHHEDNFGADISYPIINDEQITAVKNLGVEQAHSTFYAFEHWEIGVLHWPQAIITLLDPDFHFRKAGLLLNNNYLNIVNLIKLIEEKQWRNFTVYGAGIFFEQFYEIASTYNFTVERLVDRKAELSGEYQLQGLSVNGLAEALKKGSRLFVVTSFAFKDDIARNIYNLADEMGYAGDIEVISL